MRKLSLAASVQRVRGESRRGGKPPVLTCVTVTLGRDQVAVATVYGDYGPEAALKEFLKTATHPRWKRMPGWGSAVLAGMIPGVKPPSVAAAA